MLGQMTAPQPSSSNSQASWAEHASKAKPLFKWAGGKQRFLWDHRDLLPSLRGRYHEPFAGGLSVFFHLAARSESPLDASLGDVNLRVMRTYEEVKWDWRAVADKLRQLEAGYNAATDKVSFYNDVRSQHNRIYPSADAARFIFLMNVAWNGVFRINQAGAFNVPHGALKGPLKLPDDTLLSAVSYVLQSARLRVQSWESGLNATAPGDFAFIDPPYFHTDDRRDLYEKNRNFTYSDHVRLANMLVELKERGVDFLLTNSAFDEMIALYRDRGLGVQIVDAHRSISSKAQDRGREGELVVTPGGAAVNTMLRSAQLKLLLGDAFLGQD